MRNKIFEKIPVTIPNRSGFDLSHENRGTAKVGILVPVMCREMEGHDSLSVNLGAQIQFAPFATDFYGRIKCYFESFFVPYRIIDGSYKDLYSYSLSSMQNSGSSPSVADGAFNSYFEGLRVYDLSSSGTTPSEDSDNPHPQLDATMTADPSVGLVGPGTLLDYLGVKCSKIVTGSGAAKYLRLNNYHRLSAYHRIYEEYYMDARIQKHAFARYRSGSLSSNQMLLSSPYRGTPYNSGNKVFWDDGPLLDGVYMTGLRSRNYAKDYFTTATPDPQFGGEIGFEVDASGRATISQVRVANALQQFVELHNKCGIHYDDLAFARTGIRPSDAAVDIPVYLGRQVYDVYNKSVSQSYVVGTASSASTNPGFNSSPNPFNSIGAKYANGQALGSGHICDFTATEGGIFMVLMSVVPDASYGTGSVRQWDYDNIFDLPAPQLEGIGDQPIYLGELLNSENMLIGGVQQFVTHDRSRVFGYTQRFAEAKFMLDETHGLLRDGMTLSSFALKRSFFSDPALGKQFLEVPISALSEVSAIPIPTGSTSTALTAKNALFSYWYDCYFDVKLVSNLSAYSIPTLENMKGHTEMVDNGGRRF